MGVPISRSTSALARAVGLATLTYLVASAQTPGTVTWTNLVNATVTGTTLQKTSGCDGCDDAGGRSQEELGGDGYIEFTVGEMNTIWVAGLSHGTRQYELCGDRFCVPAQRRRLRRRRAEHQLAAARVRRFSGKPTADAARNTNHRQPPQPHRDVEVAFWELFVIVSVSVLPAQGSRLDAVLVKIPAERLMEF